VNGKTDQEQDQESTKIPDIDMGKKSGQKHVEKDSPEYLEKRMKNNRAVKRSRDKTKAKAQEATTRVQRLQTENEHLRSTVDNMTAELKYLKEMLICQAGTSEYLSPGTEADIEYLLRDDSPTDLERISNVLAEMRRIQSMQRGDDMGPSHHVTGLQHPGSSDSHSSHLDYQQLHPVHF